MKKINHFLIHFVSIIVIIIIGILLLNNINKNEDIQDTEIYMKNYNIYAVKTPDSLFFAGEKVPLDRWFVKESLDRELLVNTYWHSNTFLMIKRANRYFPMIERILAQEEVPDDFKYLALIESGLDPTAKSPAKASGLWQFMKATAKYYDLEINEEVDERYNFYKATHAACKHFKDLKRKLGTWTMVATAYNLGEPKLKKQMNRQLSDNYYDMLLNPETSRYVYRILAAKTILSKPHKYGFRFSSEDLYPYIPTYQVTVDSAVESWAEFAKKYDINYYVLKIFNRWLREDKLTNKNKKTYIIRIPEKEYVNFDYSEHKPKDSK